MSTTAVIFPRHRMIAFGPEVPADLRGPIGELGGRVEEGIGLDWSPEAASWPEGTEAPEQVLCVSQADPKHYKVFRHAHQINGDYRPTGMLFTVLGRPSDWRSFTENLGAMERIAGHTDASDTDEVWAEVDRLLSGRAG